MMHLVPGVQPQPCRSVQDYEGPTPGPWLTLLNSPDKISSSESTDNDSPPQSQAARPVPQVRADSPTAPLPPPDGHPETSATNASSTQRRGGSSSTGSSRRTVFTRHQISELEARFREQTFLSKEERAQLAEDLGLAERQIMIWFQNRRGRLKRRGPSDTAYTADKLKELNTRRPYPFLYGLLSSMQYRYPDTHHHPYQHLVPDRTSPKDDPGPSDVASHQGRPGTGPPQYPHPASGQAPHPAPRDVTPTNAASSVLPPGVMPPNVSLTPVSSQGPMPPNVTVHQMAWSHQGSSGPTFSGDYNIRPMYPTGHPGWERSRAGPIRAQTNPTYQQRNQMPSGHPYCPTNYWPAMSPPLSQSYLSSNNGRTPAFPARQLQTPLSQTTTANSTTTHAPQPSPGGGGRVPAVTMPPAVSHTSPVSSASSGSPGSDQVGGRISMQASTCLGPHGTVLNAFSSPLLAAGPNYDFNPQIDFNNYVPDFPDITSTLYPYTQQTC